jgi:hypothetical protein
MEKRSLGRKIWVGTTRFVSFMGGLTLPAAQAWNLAGGPGGEGAVVLANFMQKFGHPAVQHVNEKVYMPRVQSSPYASISAFNQLGGTVRISTEATESLENLLSTRYDAITGSSSSIY